MIEAQPLATVLVFNPELGSIGKAGGACLRTLLVLGARSVLNAHAGL